MKDLKNCTSYKPESRLVNKRFRESDTDLGATIWADENPRFGQWLGLIFIASAILAVVACFLD